MNTFTKLLVPVVMSLLFVGCGKDSPLTGADSTGIEVTGYLTQSLIHTTSTQPLSDVTPVELRIVGLPGAAINITEVKGTNQRSGETQMGAVAGDGSFELSLMVLKSDSITLAPVGVDTEESLDIQVDDLNEFPDLGEPGTDIEYAMDFLDDCDAFEDENSESEPDPGPEDEGEWEHDWSDEDFAPESEEDCEMALVQIYLLEPLLSGQLLLFNSELNLVESMESADQQEWHGMIRALPGHDLWLVHEIEGDWSTVYSMTVPE